MAIDLGNSPPSGSANPTLSESMQIKTVLQLNNVENIALSSWTGSSNLSLSSSQVTGLDESSEVWNDVSSVVQSNSASWGNLNYIGMMSSPPLTGDYSVGDFITTYSGDTWTCICAGNPGIWQTPNQDVFADELSFPPCEYFGERVYPGTPSTPTVMTTGRAYAVLYPLSEKVAISTIRVGVTGAGYNGAKIHAGIYEDNHGTPKKKLGYGEIDVNTTAVLSAKSGGIATMGITICDPVSGIPISITVASAGSLSANGVYTRTNILSGLGVYRNSFGYTINYVGGAWTISNQLSSVLYGCTTIQNRPDGLFYTLSAGSAPLPYVTGEGAPVEGGRWLWVVLMATGGSGAEPQVQFMNSSPYYPSVGVGFPSLTYNGFGLYKDGYTALPERYNRGNSVYGSVANAVPRFSMSFAVPTTLPRREPDRHLALGPTEAYEQNALQEPNVYYDDSRDVNERYVMTYTTGWGSPALAWATAPHPRGPWSKKGVFWDASVGKSSLFFDNDTHTLYVYTPGATLNVRSGPNPGELGVTETVCLTQAAGTTIGAVSAGPYQNTHVLKRGINDYVLFVEANVSPSVAWIWSTGYATASSASGPFTFGQFPVASLQRHPSSTYGGPCCYYSDGLYKMYIHSGEGGINPTEIYYCTSPNLSTWTGSENPVIRRESRWEVDQVADPHFFRDPVSGLTYLYWDALDNFMPRSVIMVSNPNVLTLDG